jgi:hypothetical protein
MANSYSKQLEDWVKQRDTPRVDGNLVRFLAVKDDIGAAIASGFTFKTIWANMREAGRINFSYHTFLRYVKRHLRTNEGQTDASVARPAPVKGKHRQKTAQPDLDRSPAAAHAPHQGFTFDPFVKLEDLI